MNERRPIDGGSPAYWQELKEGYTLIGCYRRARVNAERAPTHYGINMNEDGEFDQIHDNLGPWEKVDETREAVVKQTQD